MSDDILDIIEAADFYKWLKELRFHMYSMSFFFKTIIKICNDEEQILYYILIIILL